MQTSRYGCLHLLLSVMYFALLVTGMWLRLLCFNGASSAVCLFFQRAQTDTTVNDVPIDSSTVVDVVEHGVAVSVAVRHSRSEE